MVSVAGQCLSLYNLYDTMYPKSSFELVLGGDVTVGFGLKLVVNKCASSASDISTSLYLNIIFSKHIKLETHFCRFHNQLSIINALYYSSHVPYTLIHSLPEHEMVRTMKGHMEREKIAAQKVRKEDQA